MTFNDNLIDKLIMHFLGQERLKNGAVRRYLPIIRKIDKTLLNLFSIAYDGTKEEMAVFISRVKKEKKAVYLRFRKALTRELKLLSYAESKFMIDLLGVKLTKGLVNRPDQKKLERIARSEVRGLTVGAIITRLEQSDINNFVTNAKTSVRDGLSVSEARTRLRNSNKTSSRHVSTIVHTLMTHVAGEADKIVFKDNKHLIKGIKLIVTFDNKTSSICQQHSASNILYPVENYPQPPFHMNCRTRAMPVMKSFAELTGKDQIKVPVGTRVSMTGSIPADFTYGQWLRNQTDKIQNDALGYARAELFRQKKFSVGQFIDPTGKYYTLDQLFNKKG
jgi:hypothetical protein